MAKVRFHITTSEKYAALEEYDQYTLYWLKDTQSLYKGADCYGVGLAATEAMSGLLPAADKAVLEDLKTKGLLGIHAADNSLVIDTDEDGAMTVGVKMSTEAGNSLSVRADGLFVPTNAVSISLGDGLTQEEDGSVTIEIDESNANGLSVSPDGLAMDLATTTNAGALSAQDKQKLDDIDDALTWVEF